MITEKTVQKAIKNLEWKKGKKYFFNGFLLGLGISLLISTFIIVNIS